MAANQEVGKGETQQQHLTPPSDIPWSEASNDASFVSTSPLDGFSSRWAYWLSIVGCAVGFGNVWRFPYLCYTYGGIAFLICYIIGLFLVVWPTFTLEMGLGQMTESGQMRCFASLGKYCRSVGFIAFAAVNICTYYPLLLVWTSVYFIHSFEALPWSTSGATSHCASFLTESLCAADQQCNWNSVTGNCVADLLGNVRRFFHDECYAWDRVDLNEQNAGFVGISRLNVFLMFIIWTVVYLALVMGTRVLGYIMYVTMTVPAALLVILIGIGASLKGAGTGVKDYIAKLNPSQITKPQAWMAALGQGVFSVGVAQGSCTALARQNDRHQNFAIDSLVVIFSDTFFSILAGFAVFSVIGYFSALAGQPISELNLSGITLAFQTYPVGLSFLPGVMANIFSALFFLILWLLGVDTLLGLMEGCCVVMMESRLSEKFRLRRWSVIMVLCIFFFVVPGLFLSTNLGYFLLDSIDNYSTSIVQAFGAAAEAIAAGWIYLSHHTIHRVGVWAFWIHITTWLGGSVILGALLLTCGTAVALPVGFLVMFGGFGIALLLTNRFNDQNEAYSWADRLYYLTLYNVEPLRRLFNREACRDSRMRLGLVWSVMLKYAAPASVLILFTSTLTSKSSMYARPTEDHPFPWYVFFLSQLGPGILLIVGTVGFILYPPVMNPLLPKSQEGEAVLAEELIAESARPIDKPLTSIRSLSATKDVQMPTKSPSTLLQEAISPATTHPASPISVRSFT